MVSPSEGKQRPKPASALLSIRGDESAPNALTPIHAKNIAANTPQYKCSPPTNNRVIQEIPKPVKWDKLDKETEDYDKE